MIQLKSPISLKLYVCVYVCVCAYMYVYSDLALIYATSQLCLVGHLWKFLLRTLIRYHHQETAPWRLHCTLIYEYRHHCQIKTVLSSMTVKCTKYINTSKGECVSKKWGREESRSLSRFMRGVTSIKKNKHLKGDQLNFTVFFDLFLIYEETSHLTL